MVKETGCSLCVDFAHLYARQYGRIDYRGILEKLRPLMMKSLHCHFSGIEYTSKGEKNHVVLGEGGPGFRGLAQEMLRQRQFRSITIISESPITWKDSLNMRKLLEGLGYTFSKA